MARYYTKDRRWRATDKLLDGRIELIQLDMSGPHGWIWRGDYFRIADVGRWVNPARFVISEDERRKKWDASVT